ncbi:FHA domain-containing protein [Leucobacter coleopterorum]|uniref:FHA domain-containing protein n=1 Tax=Leucobacter coleopterorum TaxID=2714933 RepID=UPI001FCC1AFC|nr:FHA domain-containing protein [Leucobacter coleopterorum]
MGRELAAGHESAGLVEAAAGGACSSAASAAAAASANPNRFDATGVCGSAGPVGATGSTGSVVGAWAAGPQVPQGHSLPQGQPRPQAQQGQYQPQRPPQLRRRPQRGAETAHPPLVRPNTPSRGPDTGTAPPRGAHGRDLPAGVVPVDAPLAPPPPVRNVEIGEQLLLTFDTGQRAQLPIPVTVNLGRRPDPTEAEDQLLVVQDPESSVSKTHLRLDYRGESVWVTDLGSTNGSEIFDDTGEGTPLSRGVRVRLDDGSRVRIGRRSFTAAIVQGEVS